VKRGGWRPKKSPTTGGGKIERKGHPRLPDHILLWESPGNPEQHLALLKKKKRGGKALSKRRSSGVEKAL